VGRQAVAIGHLVDASMTQSLDPQALGMSPHPEGGWYRRIYAHPDSVPTSRGDRLLSTCVSFLLLPGDVSAWHRIPSPELWLWQGGGSAELTLGGSGDRPTPETPLVLEPGGNVLVPPGVWQTTRPQTDQPVLVACLVSPGFDFEDFELLDR
jgi:predicted cupin superfamily sugar epimerase